MLLGRPLSFSVNKTKETANFPNQKCLFQNSQPFYNIKVISTGFFFTHIDSLKADVGSFMDVIQQHCISIISFE